MSSRVEVDVTMAATDTRPAFKINVSTADKALYGQPAQLRLIARYRERDPRTEIKERTIYRNDLKIGEKPLEFAVPLDDLRRYSYPGRRIDISLISVVRLG
ncbi:MAG: hypothetical protein EXQ90_03465 [Rhodospirillales bacterium]|nr:hypothetical protein [Rhodospirillales bacterium]